MTTLLTCPCCGSPVERPTLDQVIVFAGIRQGTKKHRVLEAIWNGKGACVPSERVIDAMYWDDPDGGPLNARQCLSVFMHSLRRQIAGSGIRIVTRHGRGYRFVFERGAP